LGLLQPVPEKAKKQDFEKKFGSLYSHIYSRISICFYTPVVNKMLSF